VEEMENEEEEGVEEMEVVASPRPVLLKDCSSDA